MIASLRTRLTFSYLAVIVVAMGLSGLLLLSLLERYFLEAVEDSLAAQARITAQALVPGAVAGDLVLDPLSPAFNTVQQRLESNLAIETQNLAPPAAGGTSDLDLGYLSEASLQLSSQLETRIRFVDAAGTVLVDSQAEGQGVKLSNDPVVARALAGEYASAAERTGPAPAMHLALPVLVDGQLVGAVYLSQPLRDALAVVRDLRTRWLISTAVALLLSGVVGLLLSGAIARPLRRLTAAAGAVARGELDHHVPVDSRDELGRLSRAFNEMTARLYAARRMQIDFVANVSHELRTPLAAIKGTAETLRDGAVDDPQVRDRFLETIEVETDRLSHLVNDLLLLSRADSEALTLQCELVDLLNLGQETARRMAQRVEALGLDLQVDGESRLPRALGDANRIEQVLFNLLDNAIKYSPAGGVIRVHVAHGPEGTVCVSVRDEGIGIPAAALERVGERFYRADKARTRTQGGSGLGLAIARALVEAHGGRLWLESEEGRGTTARFTLPVA
jgi:signal transduction histidine kinase